MADKYASDGAFSEIDSIGDTSAVFHAIAGDKPRKTQCNHHHRHHHPNCKFNRPNEAQTAEDAETEPSGVETSFVERFKYLLIALPFVALFSFKEALEHTDGLWTAASLAMSFFYVNQRVKNSARGFEPAWCALSASIVVMIGLIGLHYALREDGVYLSLLCVPNNIASTKWLSLFWSTIVVDFSLKHVSMFIKSVFIILSPKKISIFTRSTLLVWIEFFSQAYRTLPPMVSWIRYLLELGVLPKKHSLFTIVILLILYVLLKLVSLWFTIYPMWPIFKKLTFDVPYSTSLILASNETEFCTLCLEDRGTVAAALKCGHNFCKPCLDRWLIYFNECPVCNQSLGSSFKDWRDGSTSWVVQFF